MSLFIQFVDKKMNDKLNQIINYCLREKCFLKGTLTLEVIKEYIKREEHNYK